MVEQVTVKMWADKFGRQYNTKKDAEMREAESEIQMATEAILGFERKRKINQYVISLDGIIKMLVEEDPELGRDIIDVLQKHASKKK